MTVACLQGIGSDVILLKGGHEKDLVGSADKQVSIPEPLKGFCGGSRYRHADAKWLAQQGDLVRAADDYSCRSEEFGISK